MPTPTPPTPPSEKPKAYTLAEAHLLIIARQKAQGSNVR